MDVDNFKLSIYAKGFDNDITQKLLKIADSSTMMEDVLNLIKEQEEDIEKGSDSYNDCNNCTIAESAEEERETRL